MVSSMFTNDCIRFCRMMGRAMVSKIRKKWGGSRCCFVTGNSLWLGAFYHVGAGNESRAIYDGQELEELPSMRRRAERYGLVVMCLLRI